MIFLLRLLSGFGFRASLGERRKLEPAAGSSRSMNLRREVLSGAIAEPAIELLQRVCGVFLILCRKVLPITPYFSATHFE
jgi:hypothetical protein